MKVKVTHTVNLEDVPEIVEKAICSARDSLAICASKIKFNPTNMPKMALDYNEVRERLDLLSSQLDDILNISMGWHQALQPSPPSDTEEVMVSEGVRTDEEQD
tara:strand:- start:3648 stop:3956 length:309 start_codon:yes stop_codon:yes gene_type:complete